MALGQAERAGARASLPAVGAASSGLRGFLDRISDFWFGMQLLAVWGFMTLIGVIVDQGKDPGFYLSAYPPALARLVLRLGLDNIYHNPVYILMVGLIIACMTLATFRRVIPSRLPPLRPVKVEMIPLHAAIVVPGTDETSVRERIDRFFSARGWRVRKRTADGLEWTFADKDEWARRGVLVAHLGFVLIATGTTMYWAWGYSGDLAILSGTTETIPRNGTRLHLDGFAARIDPIATRSGIVYQPIDYVSTLHVTGKDGITRAATLRVNQPLNVNGTLYYQSSYGYAVPLLATRDGKPVAGAPARPLEEGEGYTLGTTTRSVRYERFVGTITRGGGIGADPRPNNPGAVLQFFDGDQSVGEVLLPIGKSLDLGAGYRIQAGTPVSYSGIQYRHDPGVPLVGLGAFVLLGGLVVSFYFLPARFFVRTERAEDGVRVGLAAMTVKGYDIFEEQFASLVAALRRDALEGT